MESSDLRLAIQMLLDEAEGDFDDPHALHFRVVETIRTLQAEGMPVPDDLIELKRNLETVVGEPEATDRTVNGSAGSEGGGS